MGIKDKAYDVFGTSKEARRPNKKVVNSKGQIQYVPWNMWKRAIINNPLGPTAELAMKNKDPDLDKVFLDTIPLVTQHEAKEIKQQKPKKIIGRIKIESKGKDLTMKELDVETAKRMGFREYSEGKFMKVKGEDKNKKD